MGRIRLACLAVIALAAWPAVAQTEEPNTDRRVGGERVIELGAPTPPNCLDACINDPRCRAWTFVPQPASGGSCFIGNQPAAAKPDPCCMSGELR